MTESRAPKRPQWLLVLVFALVGYVIVRAADTPQGDPPPQGKASVPPSSTSAGSAAPSVLPASYDPAGYAASVRSGPVRSV
ncbi:hypothetical protein [Streptomyces sp. NPDC007856]|uniref:hypothetical protein n=1 Tax=Streptomyces sp. NPDC007856 TaxID=3364781 RepID=UPI00368F3139